MKKFIDVEATAQKIYNKYGTHPVYYSDDRTKEGKEARTDCIVLEMIYDEKRMVYADVDLRAEYEYRIPKKPDKNARCPSCWSDDGTNYDMGCELYDFCANCGQALDWTDHPWNRPNRCGRLKWYPKDER